MALQASGGISFGQIENEFGQTPTRNFGAYRISETYGFMSNIPLDSGIPQSGSIKFSDFYSKRLNLIVDFYSGLEVTRSNAKSRYDGGSVAVVGRFTTRPSNTNGKKVFVQVNKAIGSVQSNDVTVCALRTGTWDSGTTLNVEVGPSGQILGAGGNGGNGSAFTTISGQDGGNGNSGLGIEYNGTTVNVFSGGRISAGGAGGGGGGAGKSTYTLGSKGETQDGKITCGGGGGGGGAGFPAGRGGLAATEAEYDGTNGSNATRTVRGAGGTGSSATESGTGKGARASGTATGGPGGNGADANFAATSGTGGSGGGSGPTGKNGKFGTGGGSGGNGGRAGESGAAIRVVSGISYTLNNSGSVIGDTFDTGVT